MLKVILNSPPIRAAPRLNCLNRVRGSSSSGGGGGGSGVLERNKLRESF